ncbi:MAG: hypothetical protein J5574_00475 [Lachnospiraceae bacterium]|nr:hypothetical protein [Lachnospiraceae bacterium]
MKIIKFIAKCILAAVPAIALIAFTLCCPDCYMDEEYPSWKFTGRVAQGKEYAGKNFDTVILGDSGAMSSIMPELSESECVNLAVGGATSIEMYYFFEEYLKHHEAPKTAVIMFAPFHYWHIDNYETRTLYFRAIPLEKLSELYRDAKSCGAESVWKKGRFTDELSARSGLPNKYLPAINAARFTGRRADNTKAYADIVSSRGYGSFGKLDGCYDESYETSYEDMKIDGDAKLVTLYMQRLLRLCNEHGIHVRLIQPAVNTATFEGLNEHYYGAYRNYIKEMSTVCDDIEYETELRVYDGKYFADTSHLTREGAVKFTEELGL